MTLIHLKNVLEKLENEFRDALVHPKAGEFTWVAVTRLHLKKLEPYKRLVEAAKKIIDSGTKIWKQNKSEGNPTKKNHTDRILCAARDPESDTFATVGADETLRFWKPVIEKKKSKSVTKTSVLRQPLIR